MCKRFSVHTGKTRLVFLCIFPPPSSLRFLLIQEVSPCFEGCLGCRYGQNKSVYVYRLLAAGTMEEKIYLRQVTKEGLSARIVDEQNVSRNFTQQDIDDLFNPVEEEEEESESECEKEVEIIDAAKETLQERCSDQQEHSSLPATAVEQANKGAP